jgi:hypothetical protein
MRASDAILWVDALIAASAVAWALVVAYTPQPDYGLLRRLTWLMAVCLWIFALVWDVTSSSPLPIRVILTAVVFAVTGVLLCEGIRWTYRAETRADNPFPALSQPIIVEKPQVPTLFLECVATSSPRTMPESGIIWTLQLQQDGNGGGSLGQLSGPPGGEMGTWFWEGYRCRVINYSDKPVANVEIVIDLITYAAIPVENGFHNGQQSAHKEITVRIPKIDSGKDNPFTFYILNMAKQFMEIRFLEKTKLTIIGDKKIYDGTLQQSYLSTLNLAPRR